MHAFQIDVAGSESVSIRIARETLSEIRASNYSPPRGRLSTREIACLFLSHTPAMTRMVAPRTRAQSAAFDISDVEAAVDMIPAAPSMTVRVDVGLQQARNSTLNSYLEKLLFLLTGNFAKPGANELHTWLQPMFSHSRPMDRAPVAGQLKIA